MEKFLSSKFSNLKSQKKSLMKYVSEIESEYKSNLVKLKTEKDKHKIQVLTDDNIEIMTFIQDVLDFVKKSTYEELFRVEEKTISFSMENVISGAVLPRIFSPIADYQFCEKTYREGSSTYTLEEDRTELIAKYSSCYNLNFIDYVFNSDNEETLSIEVTCTGNDFTHHYISFMNESYYNNMSCPCLYKEGYFYLHYNGKEVKKANSLLFSSDALVMTANVPKVYTFRIRATSNEFDIIVDDELIYTVNLEGENYRFFVGKCNSGDFKYRILK